MIIKNGAAMKSLFNTSFIYALLSYVVFLSTLGMFIVSDEMKDFELASMYIEKHKTNIIMMSLLMESEVEKSELQDLSSEEELVRGFEDSIYSPSGDTELLPEEKVARRVMHRISSYMSEALEDKGTFWLYRSYTGKKYIMERAVEGHSLSPDVFTKERCDYTQSCSIYAWPDQLSDRIIITPPYADAISNREVISLVSPVYRDGEIIGDFVLDIGLDVGFVNDKELTTKTEGRFKYVEMVNEDYPFPEIAFTSTYIGDNKTIFAYRYPLSKLVLKHSWFFFFAFVVIALLEYNRTLARTRKEELDTAVTSAVIDELTGIYNRKVYRKATFYKVTNESDCVVIAIDGNRIKQINDQYGHHIGDEAIKAIARAMQQTFRKSDYLIRTGGDEFIAVLPNCSTDRAMQLCEDLSVKLSYSEMPISGVKVTASCGIAMKYKSMTLKEAIMKADDNLYQKKRELEQ